MLSPGAKPVASASYWADFHRICKACTWAEEQAAYASARNHTNKCIDYNDELSFLRVEFYNHKKYHSTFNEMLAEEHWTFLRFDEECRIRAAMLRSLNMLNALPLRSRPRQWSWNS